MSVQLKFSPCTTPTANAQPAVPVNTSIAESTQHIHAPDQVEVWR